MNEYKFCLFYEVQDSCNETIDSHEDINKWTKKPLLFDSVEEAVEFRSKPDWSLISNTTFTEGNPDLTYCNIMLYEDNS